MASIYQEIQIAAAPDDVWAAVRDVGAAHKRLVPGVLTDAYIEEGGAARIVTFANGAVVRELLVNIDDDARRFAYAVVDGPLNLLHHNASMQVFDDGHGGSRFVWTTDVLPDSAAARVRELVEQGSRVIKQTLED
ncbi:MAG TPA: MxaD family protein [Micromonosporaceae bacterium]|nr:MxaD family protein [Micromonosporaceae bacterium]HCU51752.1 MxaD family protein [Micromonosporaceae bacterium]